MKPTIFIIITILFLSHHLNGQQYFSRHYDFEGDNDIAWNIAKAGYRYVVFSANYCHQNKVSCSGLLCFDENLDLLWKMQVDSVGPLYEECMTTDDQFIYYCVTPDYNPNYVMRLYKIDLNGKLIQMKELGPFSKRISPIVMNHHNGVLYMNVVYWHDGTLKGYDSTQVWYMDKYFNIIHSFTDTDKNLYEDLTGYLPTASGNFISSKTHYNASRIIRGEVRLFNQTGNIIQNFPLPWTHDGKYGLGLEPVKPTRDHGCVGLWHQEIEVFFNDTFPMQPMVYKMDSLGNIQWHHIFYSKYPKRIKNLFEAKNGDIILIGDSEKSGKSFPYKCGGWVVRLSPDGKILWEKSYNDSITLNGYSHFYDGLEMENGELLFCGSIMPKRNPGIIINTDNWIIHTDRNGCILPSCDSFQVLTKPDDLIKQPLADIQFTNPVLNECLIQSKTIVTPVTITITDLNSNTTYKQIISGLPINLNLSSIHAGVYILSVYDPKINFKVCYKLLKL
ncbi:MAG: T9SS type A sorting domain-containing protein [Saprospiraceae bacterium]|jgi:hypothetical protein